MTARDDKREGSEAAVLRAELRADPEMLITRILNLRAENDRLKAFTPSHVEQFAPTQGQIDGAMAELEQCFQGSGSKGRDLGRMQGYARMVCHVRHLAVTTPSTTPQKPGGSETPRMDAALGKGADWVFAQGCKLERELAEAMNRCDEALEAAEAAVRQRDTALSAIAWKPASERPTKTGQYLCRLPHQFIVCSFEAHPLSGDLVWNYASVTHWTELPNIPADGGKQT